MVSLRPLWYNGQMRRRFLTLLILAFWPQTASAQNENLDIIDEPICFVLRSEAPYTTAGNLITAEYTRPDGIVTRHRSNFRFKAAGELDEEGYPADRAEFCSYGPFMPDRQLELTLRTLFPIFSCKTRIDQGEIVIKGYRKDEGGAVTWAECYNPDGSKTGEPAPAQ